MSEEESNERKEGRNERKEGKEGMKEKVVKEKWAIKKDAITTWSNNNNAKLFFLPSLPSLPLLSFSVLFRQWGAEFFFSSLCTNYSFKKLRFDTKTDRWLDSANFLTWWTRFEDDGQDLMMMDKISSNFETFNNICLKHYCSDNHHNRLFSVLQVHLRMVLFFCCFSTWSQCHWLIFCNEESEGWWPESWTRLSIPVSFCNV